MFCEHWITNVELMWEHPLFERFIRRLGSYGRLILLDKRGTGLSDNVEWTSATDPALRAVAEWATDDIVTVMDAAGSESAVILACDMGGWYACQFAAVHPQRTRGLLLTDPIPCVLKREDYPFGFDRDAYFGFVQRVPELLGTGQLVGALAPDLRDDAELISWLARYERMSVAPSLLVRYWEDVGELDQRSLLPLIQPPVLAIDHEGSFLGNAGRFVAEHVQNGRSVIVGGRNRAFWAPQPPEFWETIAGFIGVGTASEPAITDRVLAAVLFTDIVSSTQRSVEMGDRAWSEVLDTFERISRRLIERYRGRLVKTTGDGALATFDGPARAISCALAMREELRLVGVPIRAGLHVGEIEMRGDDVSGTAVNVAARVLGVAADGEVWASRTVKDLVAGSDLMFDDRGTHDLKGLPEPWQLYVLTGSR